MAYHPTHFAGLQVIFQALANRNPLVRLFGLESKTIHQAVVAEQVSALSATPTFYRLLCTPDAPIHPEVRQVTVGGERYSGKLAEQLHRVFPNARIRNIYASSEAGSLLVADGDVFRIPEQLQQVIRIREGRLEAHASLLADSLRSESAGNTSATDPFVPTGDRVEWLVEGETFRIIGREGEQLNVGGFKVHPAEIEDAISGFLEVAEVRVYGRPNSVTGMMLCSDIRLHTGQTLTVKEVRRRLGALLPAYKVPGLVNFVESIAQTYSGKQAKPQ
jgi:acyl-CoA synthetase (AMP-forming)/AMP-acid ligase II